MALMDVLLIIISLKFSALILHLIIKGETKEQITFLKFSFYKQIWRVKTFVTIG